MRLARPDGQRARFRPAPRPGRHGLQSRPRPQRDPRRRAAGGPQLRPPGPFVRLSAEELREDPDDRFVALIGRHLPALLQHRGLVAAGLVTLGLAKLVAAAAMWEGHEWGGYLLAATVALLLPFDLRQAMADPTWGHVLLAVANAAALAALVLLLRGWLPGRPPIARPNRR